ncbi:hypothetical protein FHG87_001448, partial [Trinorchestia longiramus]
MRVCCMGVLEDEASATHATKPAASTIIDKEDGQEKHSKDVQVKEKQHKRKNSFSGDDWLKKNVGEKRDTYRDKPPRVPQYGKIPEEK